jgi:adenosylcobinamide kinase / adenosylcobinamide-phosphate guanylyltransferase
MGEIIFIVGGARSGKSGHAVSLAKEFGRRVAYIATCDPKDDDLKKRVELHKMSRPRSWKTYEEPQKVSSLLGRIGTRFDAVIIDCLTLLTSNLMLSDSGEKAIRTEISGILSAARKNSSKIIIVSNEVGLGIHPETKLGRDFRDIAGRVNQLVAQKSDQVVFMVAGIPWRIK